MFDSKNGGPVLAGDVGMMLREDGYSYEEFGITCNKGRLEKLLALPVFQQLVEILCS
jgi:hypothetical protein